MEGLDYWRICDELTIFQAALLIAGCDPGGEHYYVENWDPHKRPHGYEAAKSAIANALRSGTVDGAVIPIYEYDINGNTCGLRDDTIDLNESRVKVESLRRWLELRGLKSGFFFPDVNDVPDYLDRKHPRYAPKLAAAVSAWKAVSDPAGKHPKQALAKWLREHAAEFGLSDDEGKPNETGIEETAKVANWQPGGGAPRTPQE
jgi:hypothetical protein